MATAVIDSLSPVTNDAERLIDLERPYSAYVELKGTCPLFYHRYSVEAVKAKSGANKNSRAKKTDDLESYVYRTENGNLGIPSEWLRMAIVNAARSKQDPRSPRKSAMDLFKAGVLVGPEVCDTGAKTWDYVDQRCVCVQRSRIVRERPCMRTGWPAAFLIEVILPEYISPDLLYDVVALSGRVSGIGDYRPTYGHFLVERFQLSQS